MTTEKRVSFSAVAGGILEIGDRTSLNRDVTIICRNRITIGKSCLIAPKVMMFDHDHYYDSEQIISSEFKNGEIVIGNNCWIGSGSIILKNTHIGDGTVIGAGCIVKGNIPPHSIVKMNREMIVEKIKK